MKMNLLKYIFAAGAVAAASSCADGSYAPGPEVSSDTISAYFSSSTESNYVLTPEEYAEMDAITLTVNRLKTDEAVSVPVSLTDPAGVFELPETVDFAAGEASASLALKPVNLQVGTTYSFVVRIAEEYTDSYSMLDGSPVFAGTVLVAKCNKVVNRAYFYESSGDFPSAYSDIYNLEGQNKFYIENFLGLGINVGFTITGGSFSSIDKATWKGYIQLTDHVYNDLDDTGLYWWLLDDNGDYIGWDNVSYGILYGGSDASTMAAAININGSSSGYVGYWQAYVLYDDGNYGDWTYITYYWDESNLE